MSDFPSFLAFLLKKPIIGDMVEARKKSRAARIPWKWIVIFLIAGLLLIWTSLTPPGLLGKADAVGYAVCHQIDVRSFEIGTRQFPLCARCTGQFLGILLTLSYLAIVGKRGMGKPSRAVIVVLAGLVLAYAVDGLNSYLHLPPLMTAFPNLPRLYEPNNTLRLLTGTGVGLVIGTAVVLAFNSSVWRRPGPQPALKSLASLGVLMILALLMDGLILLEIPLVMYPLAILSALATLTVLTLVYTIVILMLLRQENCFERLPQLALPLLGGFGIALLQIAIIDLLRYLLTGTWDGFHLG
jgi:uncharacterized membrane protein